MPESRYPCVFDVQPEYVPLVAIVKTGDRDIACHLWEGVTGSDEQTLLCPTDPQSDTIQGLLSRQTETVDLPKRGGEKLVIDRFNMSENHHQTMEKLETGRSICCSGTVTISNDHFTFPIYTRVQFTPSRPDRPRYALVNENGPRDPSTGEHTKFDMCKEMGGKRHFASRDWLSGPSLQTEEVSVLPSDRLTSIMSAEAKLEIDGFAQSLRLPGEGPLDYDLLGVTQDVPSGTDGTQPIWSSFHFKLRPRSPLESDDASQPMNNLSDFRWIAGSIQ